MASKVEISNRALQLVGASRITEFDEDSRNARSCNACYDVLRLRLLEEHTWSCAIKRAQLPKDTEAPAFTKSYQYTLPTDFLRLLPRDNEDIEDIRDYVIEGRKILTNDSAPLNIRYVHDLQDPNTMTPLFREALSSLIALEICEELTQSNTKKQLIEANYTKVIRVAKKVNAIQKVSQKAVEDTYITVRR